MSTNGQLLFTDVDKITFEGVGNASNAVIDTTTGKIGIGVDNPDANLQVEGNCFVSTDMVLGGSLIMGTVTVEAQHALSAITATGNTTPHTVEFQNADTSLVTTGNVGVGTNTPAYTLDVHGTANIGTITTTDIDVSGNLNVFGTRTILDTTVSSMTDPIIEIGRNNTLSPVVDLGLLMTRPTGNSNVAIIFDENNDKIQIGYTESNASDTDITVRTADTESLDVNINGSLEVGGNMSYTSKPTSIRVDSNVVTEYTGPHDRPLRKYPEVALTADADTGSGYKGYKVTTSSLGGGDGTGYHAFDGNYADGSTVWGSGDFYNNSDGDATVSGAASTTVSGVSGAVIGEWIGLQLPNKIRLQDVKIAPQSYAGTVYGPPRTPTKGVVAGSIDGTNWELVHSFTTSGISQIPLYYLSSIGPINSTKYYNYFRIIAEEIVGGTNGTRFNLEELCFYGYEEGSGSLDTTLKTVYNVPATTGTQLEVYYDAKDYTADTDFDQANEVLDKSGNNLHGSQNGGVGFDSTYKAFTFDGNGDYIRTSTLPSVFEGDPNLTQSAWVYFNELSFTRSSGSDFNSVLAINASGGYNIGTINELAVGSDGIVYYSSGARGIKTSNPIISDNWYHITVTKTPGNTGNETQKIYINGVLVPQVPWNASGTQVIGANPILTIGGSGQSTPDQQVKGSIANVRLYSKALNADQVKELYDYQKDYFLGSKSQVTLYKGHLGVGVTEPSGQLELAGDERIQEYPPGPMGRYDYETLIPGHGVFCAYASVDSSPHYAPGGVFDKTPNIFYWDPGSGGARYSTSSPGNYLKNSRLATETALGEYLVLKLPYKIKLDSFSIARQNGGWWVPQEIIYYAKSEEEDLWEQIHSHGSIMGSYANSTTSPDGTDAPIRREVKSTKFYRYFALVITKANGGSGTSLNEWRLFGTPGPTTLDKGSLSLTRSLDVPRVSRYDVDTETPRPEKLVLDFDTTVNSSPTDISGNGNHGTFSDASGVPTYSAADKAFDFDGVNGAIWSGPLSPAMTGDRICSMSCWFKTSDAANNNTQTLMWLGAYQGQGFIGLLIQNNQLKLTIGSDRAIETTSSPIQSNQWYHVVAIKSGTGQINSSTANSILQIYINGEKSTDTTFQNQTGTLNITTNFWYLGSGNTTGAEPLSGYISNPKLYDTVLEPSEVRKLYNLGRTGRSMVISDTAVGIGKVPEAQLDVRGTLAVRGDLFVSSPKIENLFYAPLNWSYADNTNYETNLWSFTYTAPVDGYLILNVNAHYNYPYANQSFYAWIAVDNKTNNDSALYDSTTVGGSSSDGGHFHEYNDTDISWKDMNHSASAYVSAGDHTISLRFQKFTNTYSLSINGAGIKLLFIPKNYM